MTDCITEVPTSQRQPSRLRRGDQRAAVCTFCRSQEAEQLHAQEG